MPVDVDVPGERGQDRARLISLSKAGFSALSAGRLEDADHCFREMLLADSGNSYGLVGLAETARARGDLRWALRSYERCVELHPDNQRALRGLFDCLREVEEHPRAVEVWESRLRDSSPDAMAYTHAGDLYRRLGRFEDSRAAYQRALEKEPANTYALHGMGQLLFDSERYGDARACWVRLRDADPRNVRVLTSLGNCCRRMRQFDEALDCYQAALELDPRNFFALYGVADSYRGLQMREESLRSWEALLELEPANRIVLTRAGDACRSLRKLEQAERYYRAALAIDFDSYAMLGMAQAARMGGDPARAVQLLLELLGREPGNDRAALEAADCYVEMGETARAVEVLEQFPESGPKHARIREKLAGLGR